MSTKKVDKKKLRASWDNGQISEERWWRIHPEAKKTDYQTDRYRHVDFWHDDNKTIGVDVKGRNLAGSLCLEFKNTVGERGWMHGDATWIAMEVEDLTGFFRFDRDECLDWCRANISIDYVDRYKDAYKKLYTRAKWGKKDVITAVTLHDLLELSSLVYIPWNEEDMTAAGGAKTSLNYSHPISGEVMIFELS